MRIVSMRDRKPRKEPPATLVSMPLKGIRWGLLWRALCPFCKTLVLDFQKFEIIVKGKKL